jgi:hypothetical protein
MKTIHKFHLNDFVLMPKGAKPLHVNHQGTSMVWALVDDSRSMVTHKFNIVGTGWDLEDIEGEYLGTVHEPNGFVWHVFYVGE